jgi:hypothetical protein
MKLSLDLKHLAVLDKVKKNYSILLWLFLAIVVLLESTVILSEWRKISQAQSDPNIVQAKAIRVNLEQHEKLEEKLNENANFQPRIIPGGSSFGVAPATNN